MAITTREISASPDDVWAVLSDGWLYGLWVVGASHIRAVDVEWPHIGSRIHHSVGAWPILINDQTEVVDAKPSTRLYLVARAWPAGSARVDLDLEPTDGGCLVRMNEYPMSGIGKTLFNPLADKLLHQRNVESLDRLAALVEGRKGG